MAKPALPANLAPFVGNLDNPRTWKGLGQSDKAILDRHRSTGWPRIDPSQFHALFWVPVGNAPDGSSALHTQAVAENWRKRIDLVLWHPEIVEIIEIKPSASYVALGQVLAYAECFRTDYGESPEVHSAVMTDCLDPDLHDLYHEKQVGVYSIPGECYVSLGRPT